MHRSTTSSSNGGLFKGGIFGGSNSKTSTRPSTSSGSPTTHRESAFFNSTTPSGSSTFSRKASLSSNQKSPKSAGYRSRNNSSAISSFSPERRTNSSATHYTDTHPLPGAAPSRQDSEQPRSADILKSVVSSAEPTPNSGTDSFTSTTPYANMLVRPSTGYQSIGPNNGPPAFAPLQPPSPTLETITYQHIQETSSKRISTLDYLRKA